MEYKKILLFGGSGVLIFVFLLGAYKLTSKPQASFFPQLTELKSNDHVKWATESANILIEYSDFQCPACGSYSEFIKSLDADDEFTTKVKGNIAFVYRHFPLDNSHPNARVAAYAAEAAGNQGKFFEMHDLLFAKQAVWSENDKPEELFKEYAKELELDPDQFEADSKSSETKDRVQNDYSSGLEVDVPGTPAFFLNGYKLQSPNSAESFKELLLKEIESQEK